MFRESGPRRALLWPLLGAAALSGAVPSRAQELGGRVLDPYEASYVRMRSFFDGVPASPDLLGALPQGSVSRWQARVGVDATYTDNVDLVPNHEREAFQTDGTAGLSWLLRSPRFEGSAEARYAAPVYRSDAVDDRETQSGALAATVRWQAAQRFSLSARGDATRNVTSGLETSPEGLRTDYQNRFDEYTSGFSYDWQPLASLRNTGAWDLRVRDYRSSRTEGEDTRSQGVSEGLRLQATNRDSVTADYSWDREEGLDTDTERTNHTATVGWTRDLRSAGHEPPQSVRFSYGADRGLYSNADGYWTHTVRATYTRSLSRETDVEAGTGYEWVRPDAGDSEGAWLLDLRGTHRFSPQTSATADLSQAYEYAPATSRTTRTVLTRVRRAGAALTSRLARDWDGSLGCSYAEGRQTGVEEGIEALNYWTAEGNGSLRWRFDRDWSTGVDGRVSRRGTTPSIDDYTLWEAGISADARPVRWLSARARYGFSRRVGDQEDSTDGYRENRVTVSVSANW